MAIMLRTLGIPTRNVTGFIGGTYNRFGRFYAVRQGDAHSWLEVWLTGEGWTRFDPTPSSDPETAEQRRGVSTMIRDLIDAAAERWNRNVVGYDLGQQLQLLSKLRQRMRNDTPNTRFTARGVASTLAGVLILGAAGWLVWRIRRTRNGAGPAVRQTPHDQQIERIVTAYKRLDAVLSLRGVPRPVGVPPLSHARALASLGHPVAELTLKMTETYLAVRFGDRPFGAAEEKLFDEQLRSLRELDDRRAA